MHFPTLQRDTAPLTSLPPFLAKRFGLSNVKEYFQQQYAAEIEALYNITDGLVKQINPETGHRWK